MRFVPRRIVYLEGTVKPLGILDLLGKRIIFFDGATGTYLQDNGLGPGEFPE